MLLISRDNDKKDILDIYNTVFSGESDFAERFFDIVWKKEYCLSVSEKGKTVSAVNVLPFTLTDGENEFSAGYIYAAMTLPEYRGKGIMGRLLSESFDMGHDFSILIVQNDSLFDYYSRFGYLPICTVSEKTVAVNEATDFTVRRADISDYARLLDIYRTSAKSFLAVKREKSEFERISRVYALPFYVAVRNEEITSYCIGYKEDDIFTAMEAVGEDADALTSTVAKISGCKSATVRTIGTDKPIGMIKPLSDKAKEYLDNNKKVYINLLYN